MSKTTNKVTPEVRERAVRLVFDTEGQHGSRWPAIVSMAAKDARPPVEVMVGFIDAHRDAHGAESWERHWSE